MMAHCTRPWLEAVKNIETANIDEDGMSFLLSLLKPEPQQRMTASEACEHDWLRKAASRAPASRAKSQRQKQNPTSQKVRDRRIELGVEALGALSEEQESADVEGSNAGPATSIKLPDSEPRTTQLLSAGDTVYLRSDRPRKFVVGDRGIVGGDASANDTHSTGDEFVVDKGTGEWEDLRETSSNARAVPVAPHATRRARYARLPSKQLSAGRLLPKSRIARLLVEVPLPSIRSRPLREEPERTRRPDDWAGSDNERWLSDTTSSTNSSIISALSAYPTPTRPREPSPDDRDAYYHSKYGGRSSPPRQQSPDDRDEYYRRCGERPSPPTRLSPGAIEHDLDEEQPRAAPEDKTLRSGQVKLKKNGWLSSWYDGHLYLEKEHLEFNLGFWSSRPIVRGRWAPVTGETQIPLSTIQRVYVDSNMSRFILKGDFYMGSADSGTRRKRLIFEARSPQGAAAWVDSIENARRALPRLHFGDVQ